MKKRLAFGLSLLAIVLSSLVLFVPTLAANTHVRQTVPSSLPAVSSSLPPAWFQLAPTGGPPEGRGGFNLAVGFDQTNDRLIFFGGLSSSNVQLNDTWVLSGADGTVAGPTWTQLSTVNTPAGRYNQSAAYDATDNMLIMYGGCLGLCTPIDSSVYTLTHANGLGGTPTWTQLSTAGGPPPTRDAASAVYDPTTNSLIIFGGDNCCGGRYNDTWILSNANGLGGGTPTWTQLSTAGSPPPTRVPDGAVYDATNNRMIIFGGNDCCGNTLNDTWVLSNANGSGGTPTWMKLATGGTLPTARGSISIVYDSSANKLIVVDGSSLSGFLSDIWTLSHANGLGGKPAWSQATPVSTSPSARSSFAVGYNTSQHRLVIFGGADSTGLFNDTWVLMNIR